MAAADSFLITVVAGGFMAGGPPSAHAMLQETAAQTLARKASQIIDVRDFGAVCDITSAGYSLAHDDTKAITSAINFVNSKPGKLWFPAGGCKVTSVLPTISGAGIQFLGQGNFEYQSRYLPNSWIDLSAQTSGDGLYVTSRGFVMQDFGIVYDGTAGGPLAPPAAPALSQVACPGGLAGTYFVETEYDWTDAGGYYRHTKISAESKLAVSTGNCLRVASPAPEGRATGWRVFIAANPTHESMQVRPPIAIGVDYTMPSSRPLNVGIPPYSDTSASAAFASNQTPRIERSKIMSTATFPAVSNAIGILGFSYVQVIACMVESFDRGIAFLPYGPSENGAPDMNIVRDSLIRANNTGIVSEQFNALVLEGNEYFLNKAAAVQANYGTTLSVRGGYVEDNYPHASAFILGAPTTPPVSRPYLWKLRASTLDNLFINCKGFTTPAIKINAPVQGLSISNIGLSSCGNVSSFVQNDSSSGAALVIKDLVSDDQSLTPTQWLSSTRNVIYTDVDLLEPTSNGPAQTSVTGLTNLAIASGNGYLKLTGQTTTLGTQNIVASTPPNGGTYEVAAYIYQDSKVTCSSYGTFRVSLAWHEPESSSVNSVASPSNNFATIPASTGATARLGPFVLPVSGKTAIYLTTTIVPGTGCGGSGSTYTVVGTAMRIPDGTSP